MQGWLDSFKDPEGSRKYGDQLKSLLSQPDGNTLLAEIAGYSKLFTKKSYWVFVGDGAAYDIGFGGIDHVMATAEDINIWSWIPKYIPTPGGRLQRPRPPGRLPNLRPPAKRRPKRTWGR